MVPVRGLRWGEGTQRDQLPVWLPLLGLPAGHTPGPGTPGETPAQQKLCLLPLPRPKVLSHKNTAV